MINKERVGEVLLQYRFHILLLALLFGLVIQPIVFGDVVRSWLFDIVYSAILASAMLSFTTRKRLRWSFIAFGVSSFVFTWLAHAVQITARDECLIIGHSTGVVFIALSVYATLSAVFSAKSVRADAILGCIAGYLLLGLGWGMVYSLLHLINPGSFLMDDHFISIFETSTARIPVFIYYSFVTLTTVGFGDVTPIGETARTLSWLEAVTGQFYMAVIVAAIISLLVSPFSRKS